MLLPDLIDISRAKQSTSFIVQTLKGSNNPSNQRDLVEVMMFLKRPLFASAATLAPISIPAFSDDPTYKCQSKGFSNMTWIPKHTISAIERELAR